MATLTIVIVLFAITSTSFAASSNSTSSVVASTQRFPDITVGPVSWEYIRIDLPAGFSQFTLSLEKKWTSNKAPLLCFRYGAPPLPSEAVSQVDRALRLAGYAQNASSYGSCTWFQDSLNVTVSNAQIVSGLLYMGIFSEPGPSRTQSTMISKGATFRSDVSFVATRCQNDADGSSCDEFVTPLVGNDNKSNLTTWNSLNGSCIEAGSWSYFILEIFDPSAKLEVEVTADRGNFTCLARHAALPRDDNYDGKMVQVTNMLTIDTPRLGAWYIAVSSNQASCFSLRWRLLPCTGDQTPCSWSSQSLQRILSRAYESPFDSFYIPQDLSDVSTWFTSTLNTSGATEKWIYYLLEVPHGSSGSVLSMELQHPNANSMEVYARLGGYPTSNVWDFRYNASKKNQLSFDMIYPAEGSWWIGVRYSSVDEELVKSHFSLHGCSNSCSSSGSCVTHYDTSRLGFYSFCHCDLTHGGVDCSETLLSQSSKRLQTWVLVGSNAAAILPSLLSLRYKAYSEWLVYTTSGISSAIYHSCDAGGWCALPYDTLQFLDFWLSFLAVIFTCIYLAEVLGLVKSTLHIGVAIVTAIIAKNDRTSPKSTITVVALGSVGLLLGLALDFWRQSQARRLYQFWTDRSIFSNLSDRTKAFVSKMKRKFIWTYIGIGILIVVFAGFCFGIEKAKTYWIWHSLWHVSIYTGAFFLLFAVVQTPTPRDGTLDEELSTLQ